VFVHISAVQRAGLSNLNEGQKLSFDIEAGAIPLDQRACGESVSQVMQAWTATVMLSRYAQAELLRQLGEGVLRRLSGNASPALGDEERRSGWRGNEAISGFSVLLQSRYCGGMNRHIARFSELSPPDVEDSEIEVDIGLIQTNGFIHPHPGRRQQTEKSCKCAGTKPLGRGELLGLAKESFDLLVAVNVRRFTPVMIWEEVRRGNLGARIGGAIPGREASDHAQTRGPASRFSLRGLSGPTKR